jgi:hypothetical protein
MKLESSQLTTNKCESSNCTESIQEPKNQDLANSPQYLGCKGRKPRRISGKREEGYFHKADILSNRVYIVVPSEVAANGKTTTENFLWALLDTAKE